MPATRRSLLLATMAAAPAALPARSQDAAPVRIVFPFAAGGGADAVARLMAEELRIALGRPFVVENRTGAGGRIGALAVRTAAPDGATLLLAAANQMVLQPHTEPAIGYDPVGDFRPVALVMRFAQAVVVGPDNPARNLGDLVALLRANPDRRSFGSPGAGTGAHVVGLELGRLAGVPLEHVPYRGTPAALPDLQSGRLGLFIASAGEFVEHARSGGLRILATTGATRAALLPEVPTLREAGFAIVARGWFALYAPAGTPDVTVTRLAAAVAALIAAGPVRARMEALGFEPDGGGPEVLAALQREDATYWAAMVRTSGYRAE